MRFVLASPIDYWLAGAACFCLLLFIRTSYILIVTPRVGHSTRVIPTMPLVSVLLPVRNEADRVLYHSVRSLVQQNYCPLEIVAVDDRSSDASLAILRKAEQEADGKLKVIEGRPPPPGWLGKLHALHQASCVAHGEWVLLTDADVIHSQDAVRRGLQFAIDNQLDALSLLPAVEMRTLWERIVEPTMAWLCFMRVSPTQANRRSSSASYGYGNYILVRRAALDSIGGFSRHRDAILDDCVIMENLKRSGFRVMVADGRDLLRARMYASLPEIVSGFGKNSFPALHYSLVRLAAVLFIEASCIMFPFVYLLLALILPGTPLGIDVFLSCLAASLFFGTMLIFGLRMRVGTSFFLFYLVGHLVSMLILIHSMLLFVRGPGGIWKGRAVGRLETDGFLLEGRGALLVHRAWAMVCRRSSEL